MACEQGTTRTWTRSSYSAGNGACVEVMSPGGGLLAIRDSKIPSGPRLGFAPGSWTAFLGVVDRAALGSDSG